MKNRYLLRKSMAIVLLPILVISIALIMVSNHLVEAYFREDSFQKLENALGRLDDSHVEIPPRNRPPLGEGDMDGKLPLPMAERWIDQLKPRDDIQNVQVLAINGDYLIPGDDTYLEDLFPADLVGNTNWPFFGQGRSEDGNIYYALVSIKDRAVLDGRPLPPEADAYIMVYISDSSSVNLSQDVSKVIIIGMISMVFVILILFYGVFKHIAKRLTRLEKGADSVGHGRFDTSFETAPYDEIGRLGHAMARMSRQLQLIQEEQAESFQMISHELKTPIMVMQGYIDAMMQDQFPSGSREATYQVVMEELSKLEKLTKDIIVLNKIDYLSRNRIQLESLDLRPMFEEAFDKLNLNDRIQMQIKGQHQIMGDRDSWERIIENILSNNLRYAMSSIRVELGEIIRIVNDGPHIELGLIDRITSPFVKGQDGRSGLGLTIVMNTLKLYQYSLMIKNIDGGVEYKIVKSIHA